MKRLLSLFVSLTLLMTIAVSAAAEPQPESAGEDPSFVSETASAEAANENAGSSGLDKELADITLKVKEILSIDDEYTEFFGDLYDNVSSRWNLNWSDENRSLSVEAEENGKILTVYRWQGDDSSDRFYGFDPMFPPLSRADAEQQAEDWLGRLLSENEEGRIDAVRTYLGRNGFYRFSGTVEINGLPSPITFTLELDESGIASFNRSDAYSVYVGEIPSEKPQADAQVGRDGLFEAISMELYYVSDDAGNARLQYVPSGPYTVVDAVTGKSTDMDALYKSINADPADYGPTASGLGIGSAEAAADTGAALTETELSSIENYADAMTQEAIDERLRSITELGLAGFTLQRCSYSVDSETGQVIASLRYTKEMTEGDLYGYSPDEFAQYQQWSNSMTIYKYISADARSGELEKVSTSYPLETTDPTIQVNEEDTLAAAREFLSLVAPDKYAQTERNTLSGWAENTDFVFAQTHDGYFFPENYIRVQINPAAGTVDSFSYEWNEDVAFGPSEGVIGEDEAAEAYGEALDVTLGYVPWPVNITASDDTVYARYLEWGYSYVEELRLAYYFEGKDTVSGIDALTGEAVTAKFIEQSSFSYSDLDGVKEEEAIEALGAAGVGFNGGKFEPEKILIQRDAMELLLRAGAIFTEDVDVNDAWIGDRAVWNGFIEKGTWAPAEPVTALEFIKMLVGASRFGDAAKLLSGEETAEGFTAIAQALEIIQDPSEVEDDTPITRADAARMLYVFMNRSF